MNAQKYLSSLALVALLTGGCMTEQHLRENAEKAAESMRAGPKKPAVKNITGFSSALHCMDRTMMMYGIRDLVVISEDIDDKTKKISAGAKDMLISAVSEMTQRSRGIRLIAYGTDSGNLIGFMSQRESKELYQLRPQFGIRGSISQFDENIAKESEGAGVSWGGFFAKKSASAGAASSASVSILGLDLTMMSTDDMTIVPGVTSNNTVAIAQSSTGVDAEATYSKFGMGYQMNLSHSEGKSQALRNLVDLAVIELFGKLTKTPYWKCLGGSAKSQGVRDEIESWYYSLFSDRGMFIAYWQDQLRLRGLYNKDVTGIPDDELRVAVETYRQALGLVRNGRLDLVFFTAYLDADHYAAMKRAKAILAGGGVPEKALAGKKPVPPQRREARVVNGNGNGSKLRGR
jgi:hypothetical protein